VYSCEPWGCPLLESVYEDKRKALRVAMRLRCAYAQEAIDMARQRGRFIGPHEFVTGVKVQRALVH
jgi:hypothetical protein